MFRILISDKLGQEGLDRLTAATDAEFDLRPGLSEDELVGIIPDYDGLIIRSATQVNQRLLGAAKKLRVVGRAGIGVDNVDVKSATARGVVVMNTPQANSIATAEQAMTLILSAARMTPMAHAEVAAGGWNRSAYTGIQLYRKTLGLIGFGRIARLVARRAQAFGMEVVAHDPYVSEEIGFEYQVPLLELDELFGVADFVSLHTVMSPDTLGMINADLLGKAKPGLTLVNAARGRLVDEPALLAALESGQVRMAALDVFDAEPPAADNPLVGHPRVVHTPHLGASTEEAQRDVAVQIVDQVLDALRDVDYRNSVNMPFPTGPGFDKFLPYMQLAEKIGILQFHMADCPIRKIEIELLGDGVSEHAKPIAAGVLKGLMQGFLSDNVNYINAPSLAEEQGIRVSETRGISVSDYANLVSCNAVFDGGNRVISGALFGDSEPRIVRVSDYKLDVEPTGTMLLLMNHDVPGVVGQIGTILGAYEVNIGEWRMGRKQKGTDAMSFITLDNEPSVEVLAALRKVAAVTKLKVVNL